MPRDGLSLTDKAQALWPTCSCSQGIFADPKSALEAVKLCPESALEAIKLCPESALAAVKLCLESALEAVKLHLGMGFP